MLRLFSLYLCILLTLLSFSTLAQSLNDEQIKKIGPAIWQQVNIKSPVSGEQIISAYQNKQSPLVSLSEMRGPAVAKIPLSTLNEERWVVLPQANYLDGGIAYWQDTQGIRLIADFSQGNLSQSAIIMHGQAFQLNLETNSQGVLWLYLNARHYAKPVSVTLFR
ncbi:hypothetical protein ATS73_008385 [Pseudoalteromonas sp. H100]|nr:hypothetical protein [Pseudoalteromonas sp. H100]WFO18292.1 hypothetical protein ATS73_008385 [Pseudoalteromonas sp. H100]